MTWATARPSLSRTAKASSDGKDLAAEDWFPWRLIVASSPVRGRPFRVVQTQTLFSLASDRKRRRTRNRALGHQLFSPVTDGAVPPILHINGYKISSLTILARGDGRRVGNHDLSNR